MPTEKSMRKILAKYISAERIDHVSDDYEALDRELISQALSEIKKKLEGKKKRIIGNVEGGFEDALEEKEKHNRAIQSCIDEFKEGG